MPRFDAAVPKTSGPLRRPLLRLPLGMADFARRGFRTDRPRARALLEAHARSFLTGFNIGSVNWRDPHPPLAAIAEEERGFAYEGAGMFVRLKDIATLGRAGALDTLLAGQGDGYIHLVHVGAGWSFAVPRIWLPVPIPRTPLLRWLALDGAGFADTFFGGLQRLRRRCRGQVGPVAEATIAGRGRALWFVESADPDGVAAVIASVPEAARPALWSGVGLACAYAGAVDDAGRSLLADLAGPHLPHLAQGIAFAAGARFRAGVVPEYTRLACDQIVGVGVEQLSEWTDETADGLDTDPGIAAYLTWRTRLRELLAPIVSS